jgi:ADP-ribosyl-[dinitrogen reductase] hydrolase
MLISSNSHDLSTSRTPAVRTSQTHPLQIASISMGHGLAPLGNTFALGKVQPGAMSGAWQRDLATDPDAIAAWNAAAVVTLVEPHELAALRIEAIGDEVRRRHMEWHHLPIRDYGVPDDAFMQSWPDTSERLRSLLRGGAPVLVHWSCHGNADGC